MTVDRSAENKIVSLRGTSLTVYLRLNVLKEEAVPLRPRYEPCPPLPAATLHLALSNSSLLVLKQDLLHELTVHLQIHRLSTDSASIYRLTVHPHINRPSTD